MYYSQRNNEQQESPGNMSATALLQKAAQMGSTRSHNSNIANGGSFGLMTSSTTSSQSNPSFINPLMSSRSNGGDDRFIMGSDQTNLNELLMLRSNSSSSTRNIGNGFMLGTTTDHDHGTNMDRLMGMGMGMRMSSNGGLTRDFLGVGGGGVDGGGEGRPLMSRQELTMGSAALDHYNGNLR